MNPGPRFQCGLCKKYCKASDRLLECEECEKRFHASCSNLGDNELLRIESGDGAWYCTNCKADCGLCSGAILKGHKAVRCESCDMWIHNECSFIAETQYETVNNTNCFATEEVMSLRGEIKADVRKQHDLYVNNLVGDVKATPRDFYRYINSQKKKTPKVFHP